MIKYYCDVCGDEKKNNGLNSISYLCHMDDFIGDKQMLTGYCDSDGNIVSGRSVSWKVCNRCYNKAMLPTVNTLYALREHYNNDK